MLTLALALHPFPAAPEHLALVKRAKAELDLDYLIKPVPAFPGGQARVLALGSLPPFLCDAAYVRDPNSYLSVLNALRWALGDGDESLGFRPLDYLKSIMGNETKEIFNE